MANRGPLHELIMWTRSVCQSHALHTNIKVRSESVSLINKAIHFIGYNTQDGCQIMRVFARPFKAAYLFNSRTSVVKGLIDGFEVINMSRRLQHYFLSRSNNNRPFIPQSWSLEIL